MQHHASDISPRLLTTEQAARYLGYATTGLLANIPVKPIKMADVGPGCQPKYDRRGLDCWLDGLSGLSVPAEQLGDGNEAESAYRRWKAGRG
jgi:hypothetical protein